MHAFPIALTKTFLSFGGEIQFNTEVRRIISKNKLVTGTVDQKQKLHQCRYIVIASDLRNALFQLIGKNKLHPSLTNTLVHMKASLSLCIAYFGITKNLTLPVKPGINLWYMPSFNLPKLSSNSYHRTASNISEIMIRLQEDKKGLVVFCNSDYKNKSFSSNSTVSYLNKIISQINKFIPKFSEHIIFKALYTPCMLNKLTYNYRGSAYGWESTPKQTIVNEFLGNKIFDNLFIAGHWSSMGTGIRGAAFSGWYVSKSLIDKIKRNTK
jgi:phytoene dehydrogenase-like protein